MAAETETRSARQAFASLAPRPLIAEHERLLQLRTALPALWLVPEQMRLYEGVGESFELKLQVLATSAHVDLRSLIGEELTLRLRVPGVGYRSWHGYVLAAAQAGSNGGLARYELVVQPWLALLAARSNAHVHPGERTALQLIEAVFAEYPQANWRLDVAPDTLAAMRVRPLCIQYGESDLAFVRRLLFEEGLLWRFEHPDEEAAGRVPSGRARHVLVISDHHARGPELGLLRYTQPRPGESAAGGIQQLALQAQAPLAGVALGHWDERVLHGRAGQAGAAAQPQHYDGAAGVFADSAGAQRAADQVLAASELASRRYAGAGQERRLEPGARFTLLEHPLGPLGLQLLAVEHWATNDLGELFDLGASRGQHVGQGQGQYRVHFEAAPAELALVPARPARPRAPQMLTARVVGHERSMLTTTRDLRLKVQFDFQRGERPNRGGQAYQPAVPTGTEAPGNAPGNEASGAWLRVLVPQAGADWGWVLPPRIGAEVLVHFLNGDIDQPVVAGVLHSGEHPPPWSAGVDSGVNHPGTVSGLRGFTLDGGASQHWLHDDATGQLRLRLHSSPWGSELGLGHLIQQGEHSAQRGAWRGSGFEALTQGWAVVRAGRGLLLSTQLRPGTYGSARGCQMDAAEALARLRAARELGQRLGEAAAALGAQGLRSHRDSEALDKLAAAMDPARDGRHPDRVNGQEALTPEDGRTGPGQPVPAFAEPIVALDSASSLLAASGASTQLYAGQDLSLTAQGDLHHAAAHTHAQVSGQGTSLYTHQGGIVAHAANGPVSVRAHTDALQLLAQQGITICSVNDEIRLYARDRITLGGGDSSIVLDGPDITFTTPGSYTQHGGSHAFLPGSRAPAELGALPTGLVGVLPSVLELRYSYRDLEPVAGAPYLVQFANGTSRRGALDALGYARIENPPDAGRVYFGYDSREAHPRMDRAMNPARGSVAHSMEAARQLLDEYLQIEEEALAEHFFDDEVLSAMDASDFEDQTCDYEYAPESIPSEEDEGPPGCHDEIILGGESMKATEETQP